jgi:hypothetical protein
MTKIFYYIFTIGLILLIGCAILPYWNKYLITTDMEEAAIYGTKHSIADIEKLLQEKIEDRGYVLDPENLYVEKDENKTVSISLTYQDKISFFGIVLKELEFSLDVTEKEITEVM